MVTNSTYRPFANQVFDANYYHYRFGPKTNETSKTINSISSNWIRFRITTTLTTVPSVNYVALQTHSSEINQDGFMEYFGNARPLQKTPINWSNYSAEATGVRNRSVLTDGMTLLFEANRFNTSSSQVGTIFSIPPNLDSSWVPRLQLRWFHESASTAVVWSLTYGLTRDFLLDSFGDISTVGNTTGGTNTSVTTITASVTSPSTARKQTTTTFQLSNLNELFGNSILTTGTGSVNDAGSDLIWILLQATTGSGNLFGIHTDFVYRTWCMGGYIGE